MNEVMFTVLQGIVAICTVLIMRYVLPYLRMKLQALIDAELLKEVLKAVKSVEQDDLFQLGTEKKEEVIIRITAWVNKKGLQISQSQISQLIETAVWIMKNEDKNNA